MGLLKTIIIELYLVFKILKLIIDGVIPIHIVKAANINYFHQY